MSDHAPFLAAVIAHRDDDGPRLVYADWLEERGEAEYAEFIRVQCELAALGAIEHDCGENGEYEATCPACGASCEIHRLTQRESELYNTAGVWRAADQIAAIFGLTGKFGMNHGYSGGASEGDGPLRWWWRRGFVEEVLCSSERLFDGPCQRCGGLARGVQAPMGGGWITCPVCQGNRAFRSPGVADKLFAAAPIRRVQLTTPLTDRERIGSLEITIGQDGQVERRLPGYPGVAFDFSFNVGNHGRRQRARG